MVDYNKYKNDLHIMLKNNDVDEYLELFNLIFLNIEESSDLEEFIKIFITFENEYKIFQLENFNQNFKILLKVLRNSILNFLGTGWVPSIYCINLYTIFNAFELEKNFTIEHYIVFFKNDFDTLEWNSSEKLQENNIIFLLEILNSNSNKGFIEYLQRLLLTNIISGYEICYNFLNIFIEQNNIQVETLLTAIEFHLNLNRFFKFDFYQKRSILGWAFLFLVVMKHFAKNNKINKLYPFLKNILDNYIDQKNLSEVIYLDFYIYILIAPLNQIENKQLNQEITIPSTQLYLEYAKENNLTKPKVLKKNKIKIAFIFERLVNHSIFNVTYSFLTALQKNKEFTTKYEIVVYPLNYLGELPNQKNVLKLLSDINIPVIFPVETFTINDPYHDRLNRALQIRKKLISDNIDIMIANFCSFGILNFLFTTRIADKQIYWSHGNFEYHIEGIDKKISHYLPDNNNFGFKKINIPNSLKKYNPNIDFNLIKNERNKYPKNKFILGSIGRLIKIESYEYLETVSKIMKKNKNTIYIACGEGNTDHINKKLQKLGIFDRWYFTGKIDSHLYGNIIDLYLSPFPIGGGESLEEYRHKGKPYVSILEKNFIKKRKELDFFNIYKNNDSKHIFKELYTKEDLETIKSKNYLIKENKYNKFYQNIGLVSTKDDYYKVATLLINNQLLRDKSCKEYMFIKRNEEYNINDFMELLND